MNNYCQKCNKRMDIIYEINTNNNDFYTFIEGMKPPERTKAVYKCPSCNEAYEICKNNLATKKQLNMISRYIRYVELTSHDIPILTKKEADFFIKQLGNMVNIKAIVNNFLDVNIENELIKDYIKSDSFYEYKFLFKMLIAEYEMFFK